MTVSPLISTRIMANELRRLVVDVLLPAYNDFDRAESAALQQSLTAECARDGASSVLNPDGGARTALAATGMRRKASQERRVLRALVAHLQMPMPWHISEAATSCDGTRLSANLDCNWLEIVYERVRALVPNAVWKLYGDGGELSAEEVACLAALMSRSKGKSGDASGADRPLLKQHRQRGSLPVAMITLSKLIISPLSHVASFAIPNEAALATIAENAPLIECGAGTGYWSALLQQRGVDVLAFDSHPPTTHFNNAFFNVTYCDVQVSCAHVPVCTA